MKITRVETIPVQVPIDQERAVRGGRGAHTISPFVLLRLHTDEGLVGLGEVSCTPIWSGEDQVTAAHLIAEYLAPLLVALGFPPAGAVVLCLLANSAPVMFGFALTLTFCAFDLLMSLDYSWFSTIFGVYYFAGSIVSAYSLIAWTSTQRLTRLSSSRRPGRRTHTTS